MMIPVQFPDGPRSVAALVMGRTLLKPGEQGQKLVVPRVVPGFVLSRRPKGGWQAVPA